MDTINSNLFLLLNFDGGGFLDSFFWIVSGKLTWVPLYILILYMIYRKYGVKSMLLSLLFMGIGVGISDQVCNLFKNNLPTLRPTHNPMLDGLVHTVRGYVGGLYGTVSAHAATTFSVAVFSSCVIKCKWVTVGLMFWALLVAYSRIYLGVHFPEDIMYGFILGVSIGVVMYRLYLVVFKNISRR